MRKTSLPERMCIVCRERKPKNSLWRIGLLESGAVLDPDGKGEGRGLYVCRENSCIGALLKKKVRLPGHVLSQVRAICAGLLEAGGDHE